MAEPTLILFDDEAAQAWEPFSLTRPAGELLFGALTFRARAERVLGRRCVAHLSADHLEGFKEEGTPPVVPFSRSPVDGDRLYLASRAVPAWGAGEALAELPSRAAPVEVGGVVAGWYAPHGTDAPSPEFLRRLNVSAAPSSATATLTLPGRMLRHVWELITENPEQIARDIGALFPTRGPAEVPTGVHRLGDGALIVGTGVRLEPGVVLDTRAGPIWLDDEVEVRAFTRLAGPTYVGARSVVLGGPIEAVSVGPVCKIRGELAESVCLGYTNKQHDGHMGHAYLGRWVNLGAETTNSDLKNNYGSIRLWTPSGVQDTGSMKLGCLLGDHVKTGIGLLLNTGTVIGAGSNLFGAAMPPKYVPPFSWGSGAELTEYRLDKFLEVAERAMGRRGIDLDDGSKQVLQRAWSRPRPKA